MRDHCKFINLVTEALLNEILKINICVTQEGCKCENLPSRTIEVWMFREGDILVFGWEFRAGSV